ncbi:TonB-dependent receptor [Roseateles caseinilyticus]
MPFASAQEDRKETREDREVLSVSTAADMDKGFMAPRDYSGFAFNRNFLRGFQNDSALRNGYRDYGYLGPTDFANISEIEVLKGPASALYGNGKPGGDINTLTRRIDGQKGSEGMASVNSFGFVRTELNVGGKLSEPSDMGAFRFDASIQGGPSFRDEVHGRRFYMAPGVSLRLGPETKVSIEAEVFRRTAVWDPIFLPDPVLLSLPAKRFLGEPFNLDRTSANSLRIAATHQLSPDLIFRQSIAIHAGNNRYKAATYDTFSGNPLVEADGRTVNRIAEEADDKRRFQISQTELYGTAKTFGIAHEYAIGLELAKFDYDFSLDLAPIASIDALHPVYGAVPGQFQNVALQHYGTSTNVLYMGDRMTFGAGWKAYVGLRGERFKNFLREDQQPETSKRATVVSPRIGLVYELATTNRLFLSLTHAARPQIGTRSASGEIFDAERDSQVELGYQASFDEKKALMTVSLFQIKRDNVLVIDQVNPNFSVARGQRTSRGLEFDLSGSVGPIRLNLSAALTDAFVSRDTTISLGSHLPGVSKRFISGFAQYKFPESLLGITTGIGATCESKVESSLPANGVRLPGYCNIDASFTYDSPAGWWWRATFTNLFDRYAFNSFGYDIRPIQPRTALLQVGANF